MQIVRNSHKECKQNHRGHFARGNPQGSFSPSDEVLAVFAGPHHYISPSWYENDQNVPTWNYQSVHIYGKIDFVEDPDTIRKMMEDLVLKYELPSSSYRLDQLSEALWSGLKKGIIPFSIEITKIEAKAKLSQNHPLERRKRVVEALENLGNENALSIAKAMKKDLE